ncbi:MAG: bifunctional phosphopantothenoylcysteine decarboxylase/phosphopantothenate synthase [Novosphingobium sp.]|nr:bifunctional phosphopantothenoylcysteine decarboxylase/phosphopantothenate synthase [Novosphingobium sp.]
MTGQRILLIVGGGIAAYKACELVRTIRKEGGEVTCVLTESGAQFVTPMSLAALSENPVYTTLWDLKNEAEMGHIQLSREADLIVVCPATANLLAKMASGIADDLATTLLLATDKPVMVIPAMNVRMWQHDATMRNIEALRSAGVDVMQPDEGQMACGEFGPGRLPDPVMIWQRVAWALGMDPVEVAPLPGGEPLPELPYIPQEGDGAEADGESEGNGDVDGDSDAHSEGADKSFGGLSGSMISRGIEKAKQAIGLADEAPAEQVQTEEVVAPTPTGLLMPKKGEARSAPPTDAEAINHLVSDNKDAPEPFAEEMSETTGDTYEPIPEDKSGLPLYGKHVLVTAGPTWEPIDPVRYIANRSSGKQGFAIAAAAARAGAQVTLVSGPVNLPTPPGVDRVDIESAEQMAEAVHKALPADIGVMVAAVADWRTLTIAKDKIKKRGSAPPALLLTENPDILANLSGMKERPKLLIGFAAETQDVVKNAKEKRKRKGADWIIANDVSGDVMGGEANTVHIVTGKEVESLEEMPKDEVANILVERFIDAVTKSAGK